MKNLFSAFFCLFLMTSAYAQKSALNAGERLNSGESLVSANGNFMLLMQADDGHLCVYRLQNGVRNANGFVWGSGKHGFKNAQLNMQNDGNLVVNSGTPRWASDTTPFFDQKWAGANKPVKLVLENDGKLNLYNAAGTVVWTAK